jgi:aryl-phospho-beta-D-glucosidase BglC (GH1 family)
VCGSKRSPVAEQAIAEFFARTRDPVVSGRASQVVGMNLSFVKSGRFLLPVLGVLLTACARGEDPPIEVFPGLSKIDEWDAPDPEKAPEGSPVANNGWLRVDGLNLVNEEGTKVQLRGVSSMWLNWDMRGYGTNKDGMKFMRDEWGITLFRAAMGVEESGGYIGSPTTMRNQVRLIVQNAIDLGVYVLVDWHDHNAHKHLDESKEFFEEITAEFGAYPNVIYETYNEPLHPNEVSWADDIKPYHEAILPVIRKEAPNSIAILGTPQWSQLVDTAAKDPVDAQNIMYTLHFYSCTHTDWLRETADEALALGAPLFVTEWGATAADGGVQDKTVCSDEGMLWHDWMNQNNISWAAWKLDACTDASCFFASGASPSGGWSEANLQGHGGFVVERLLAPAAQ